MRRIQGRLTQFRGLPVKRGDAFLLQSRRGTYLLDGGEPSGELPQMLRDRRVGRLRAAVCTFPSPERLGGILDLLADGYPMRECWLPARLGVLSTMAGVFNGDWEGWASLFRVPLPAGFHPPEPAEPAPEARAAVLLGLAAAGCPGGPVPARPAASGAEAYAEALLDGLAPRIESRAGGRGPDRRRLARRLLRAGGFTDLALVCGSLLLDLAAPKAMNDPRARVVRNLTLAGMAAALVGSGVRVRHFRRTGEEGHHLIPRHPLACLNGEEAVPERHTAAGIRPKHLYREGAGLTSGGRGLVFQYGDAECTALFCGESPLLFAGEGGIALGKPSVITAPGHGNASLEAAYGRIRSNDPDRDVWVRSHYSHARKVAEGFLRQPNRLCMSDPDLRATQEVVLQFDQGRWQRLAGGGCLRR